MRSRFLIIFLAVISIVAVGAASYLFFAQRNLSAQKGVSAVFLSNGQVYFSELTEKSGQWVVLKKVYYFQNKTDVQVKDNMSLVKLGQEIHQPLDGLTLNRDHILFIEQLDPNSRVVKAINDFEHAR